MRTTISQIQTKGSVSTGNKPSTGTTCRSGKTELVIETGAGFAKKGETDADGKNIATPASERVRDLLFDRSVQNAIKIVNAIDKANSTLSVDSGNCTGCRERAMEYTRRNVAENERKLSLMNPRAVRVARRAARRQTIL